jgi:hypothetical protein
MQFKKSFIASILVVALFTLSSCGQKRIVFIDSTEDILGFVEDGKIISTTVIKEGVIVTPGFVVKFKEMKKALEEK